MIHVPVGIINKDWRVVIDVQKPDIHSKAVNKKTIIHQN